MSEGPGPGAPPPKLSSSARIGAIAVLVAAVALALFGGVIEGFRPEPSGRIPEDIRLPRGLEPDGIQPEPPTVFRWEPGGSDVDLAQVLLFDDRRERIWQSVPVTGNEVTIDPNRVFEHSAAGQVHSWSVREVYRGRPRASSPLVQFSFDVDVHGRGIGESLREERPFDQ